MTLTAEKKEQYYRNIRLRRFGEAGQEKLFASHVLVIGAGGLGSPVILYLATAGVGFLTIADYDWVSLSNLQRQVLYQTSDIGRLKADCAVEQVELRNPDVRATAFTKRISKQNLLDLMAEHDFIVECSDNVETKYLVNDLCVEKGKPYSHCGVVGMVGQIMTYVPGRACLRCAFEEPHSASVPTTKELGVLGAAVGSMGALQAAETIKYLTGSGDILTDAFLHIDLACCTWKKFKVKKDKKCLCSKRN